MLLTPDEIRVLSLIRDHEPVPPADVAVIRELRRRSVPGFYLIEPASERLGSYGAWLLAEHLLPRPLDL